MNKAERIFEHNRKFIPGGVVSLNRSIDPVRSFVKAEGAYLYDVDGNKYIDYHAAFSPHLLGHNEAGVNQAVVDSIQNNESLMGAGPTLWEGELAELLCTLVPNLDSVQITNTGSEATFHAIRLARSVTGRDEVIIMQGGYNGWHNDVAFNLMDPLDKIDGWKPGKECPLNAMSAGIPSTQSKLLHAVQYNDLQAIENLLKTNKIAAILMEPILQNIGIIKPQEGFLEGIRELCDTHGTLLVFDEVKTGFRHALAGYQSICGVRPDLCSFGKAVANGYPLGVIGGKKEIMDYFIHPDPQKRVMVAGTYNAHPTPVAAAIATLKILRDREAEVYGHLETLGARMEEGLNEIFKAHDFKTTTIRQGSAFVTYFMDHAPQNWTDVISHNDMALDKRYREALIEKGIFHFPTATKQGSISFAHTAEDIEETLRLTEAVVAKLK
ncbi:glutamate-1-semialdehyde-2,1-aminomutase [Lentisphaera araneosa HTCC2155]|uniref:Glutamate-1-semialdehyde-2,1-aminomutase n=1 Tax=Lentisphaera araneosa HTCC2155 TaxID=313628 RepID=A6DKU4_9BACT|nr:aspartate aminotransferase family protein [Lentisphaera araneosa]EDM27992.1 glutamate-1-semialdehyde-2,1-aminomutase [Lentisphaera araneosa HTCC2155]